MSATPILFAAGAQGFTLNVPEGVSVEIIGRPVDATAPKSDSEQKAIVDAALAAPVTGASLHELARGKRRAVILAGDLSRPAPYEILLSALTAELVKADIRPSRIALCACPGGGGPLLGRGAIHRYGEEFCGDHEATAWPSEGTPGAIYDTTDLKIAVASRSAFDAFGTFLPKGVKVDFALDVEVGAKATIDIQTVHAFGLHPNETLGCAPALSGIKAKVGITSGGGGAWEETLEEALLSLRATEQYAETATLVFSGAEGIGSARFAQDVWALIEQAEEILAAGKALNFVQKAGAPFDPASTLADCLSRYKNTVLFAPEFCAHPEGEDLGERIAAAPNVAKRLALCGAERELWGALEMLHGAAYTLAAQPLGWRAF